MSELGGFLFILKLLAGVLGGLLVYRAYIAYMAREIATKRDLEPEEVKKKFLERMSVESLYDLYDRISFLNDKIEKISQLSREQDAVIKRLRDKKPAPY